MPFSIDKYHFKAESLLEGLPAEELEIFRHGVIRIEEKKGKLLFEEGGYPKGVYMIRKGKVKTFQVNTEGKEQVSYIYGKGESLGYRPLLCEGKHPVSARTLEDCVFSFVPKKTFIDAIDRSPILTRRLLVTLCCEFSVWINKIAVFAQQPVKARLALSLLILREKYKRRDQDEQAVVINLSREDLANYVGTSVETLVRILRSMKDDKIIETRGRKITILKPKALEQMAGKY